MANVKGTAVPNSGYVENVYLNTSLSDEEVVSLLSQLTYNDERYIVLSDKDDTRGISIMGSSGYYAISIGMNNFVWTNLEALGFVGWADFDNPFVFKSDAIDAVIFDADITLNAGLENDKLASLFSITPFTSGEETTADKLQKLIDNKQLIIDSVNAKAGTSYDIHSKPSDIANTITSIETGGGTSGLPILVDSLPGRVAEVPNNEYVGNIYFNKDLSMEEIYNILSSLNYSDLSSIGFAGLTYFFMVSKESKTTCLISKSILEDNSILYVLKIIPDFMNSDINSVEYAYLFVSETDLGISGIWSETITNTNYHDTYYTLNESLYDSFIGVSIGTENDKLKDLFYIQNEGTAIEGGVYKLVDDSTLVPNNGTIEKVYFNNELSVEETISILSELTYVQTPFLDHPIYPMLFAESGNPVIFVVYIEDLDYYEINVSTNITSGTYSRVFISKDFYEDEILGWQMENYSVNANVIAEYSGLSVGAENNKLLKLFSTTPLETEYYRYENNDFIRLKDKEIIIKVDKLPQIGSMVVPNNEFINNVYLNITLSTEEVDALLSENLDFGEDNSNASLLFTKNNFVIIATKSDTGYLLSLLSPDFLTLYNSEQSAIETVGFLGWNTDFNGVIEVNDIALVDIPEGDSQTLFGKTSGTQNDKITKLFSLTPYFEKGNHIDTTSIYNVYQKDSAEVWGRNGDQLINIGEMYASQGVTFVVYFVDKQPSLEDMIPTISASEISSFYIYWVESENEGYMLMDGSVAKYSETLGKDFPVLGVITSKDDIIEETGVYIYKYSIDEYYKYNNAKSEFIEMVMPEGTLEITEKGEYDVKELEKVNVNIESGSGEDMLQARVDATNSCKYLFYNYTGSNVDYISGLDTSKVTDMSNMFSSCSKITSIPQLTTSNVTNMKDMFGGCTSLTTIPQLDTSNVTNMGNMFYNCSALTSVPQLETNNVTHFELTFYSCSKLTTIDITYYKISSTSNVSYFVNNCTALKSLIIRGFGTNYVLDSTSLQNSGIASGTGYIYVPSAMVDTLKSATNWSKYASQIRALEDYTVDGTTTGALDESKI